MPDATAPIHLLILVTPHFNLATTTAFIDPFRVANYLTGEARFRWTMASVGGGEVSTSSGLKVATDAIAAHVTARPEIVVISSSWAPEAHHTPKLTKALFQWSRQGAKLGALDTGAFILARAKLLKSKQATVHYEHIDAMGELFPDIAVSEALFTVDEHGFTCSGGFASVDVALHLVREACGEGIANAAARYLFHHEVRGPDRTQNPPDLEPFGQTTPTLVRRAIQQMEAHLETPMTIPKICAGLGVSQRHLSRLFRRYVNKTLVQYYRDIRLDRARGLVTQTEMKLSEIAVASGFASQVHFSRAYHARFGLPPRQDRIEGRVPFEFRAWPMYSPVRP